VIEVVKAPPFATIQDLGWRTGRAFGLPVGGAMDPRSLALTNAAVGNPPGAAAIEWALGTGTLRVDADTVFAVGGRADAQVDRRGAAAFSPIEVRAGSVLSVTPKPDWRFVYVAVRGGIEVPELLGSRSTYLPGGFGGHEGRRLKSGDRLPVGPPRPGAGFDPSGDIRLQDAPPVIEALRVTRGPQWDRFDDTARRGFFASTYTVSPVSDRMGYRLSGPAILPREAATLPSEPACPGAVQIPDDGQPIVLMPDGPTVGGYPKLAVVARDDLRRLAQRPPGSEVRFVEVSLEEVRRG
jgi:5-oxoprolinase (ATP-hydrolysing) subunit C